MLLLGYDSNMKLRMIGKRLYALLYGDTFANPSAHRKQASLVYWKMK